MKEFLKILYKPVYLQLLFWIIHFFFEVHRRAIFGASDTIYYTALLEVAIYAAILNFNVFVLIPKIFYRKHYLIYILTVLVLVIGTSHFLGKIETDFFLTKIENQIDFPDKVKFIKRGISVFKAMPLMGLVFLTTIFTIGKRRDERASEFVKKRTETELQLLKNQINPHFLFNALNSVYTLSYIHSEMTPHMILKLSEMLRYVLYECTVDKVALEKEIVYLENYITFQNIKEETNNNVQIDFSKTDKSKLIAPMIFIPFIENSFKHSNITECETAFIYINMYTVESKLYFSIKNSYSEIPGTKDRFNGIGLENVKRRLELIYPDKYELNIDNKNNIFSVNLTLELI